MSTSIPEWWNSHGSEMKVNDEETNKRQVVIENKNASARVKITESSNNRWIVAWSICHASGAVEGHVAFQAAVLQLAFGLASEETGTVNSQATLSFQPSFIRQGNFLDIPCAGIGYDGDPNISIMLDDEIRSAIGKLLDK